MPPDPLPAASGTLPGPIRDALAEILLDRLALVVTDPRLPDNPIIHASPGFTALTGYDEAEVLGRNCRFLQGAGTDVAAVDRVRSAIRDGRAVTVDLVNYRKNGEPFGNRLRIDPVHADGQLRCLLGVLHELPPPGSVVEDGRDMLLRDLRHRVNGAMQLVMSLLRIRMARSQDPAVVEALSDALEQLEAVMLVSLMEAADRVDSTTGVQMAYLKRYAARAANRLELRVPEVLPRATGGKGEAHKMEAIDAARVLGADVAYLDPPYNQHSYLGNYHVWESLVVWDKPEVYGVACKRADCVSRRSVFNSRPRALGALREVIRAIDARALVVSFSDEGFVSREDMEGMLREWAGKRGGGVVRTVAVPSKRYVGAKIGIHNQRGERVGKVSHVTNTEFVFTCVREASRLCVA